jgi:HK97 family phage major capsid protein
MDDKTTNEPIPVPENAVSDAERDLRGKSALITLVETIRRNERESYEADMAEALRELAKPNRDRVPELYKVPELYSNAAGHKGNIATRSPTEPLYRRMPEDERQWRNPESDHYMAEWIRGEVLGDRSQMLQAVAKLEGMFPRAVMTEGISPQTGAFSTGTGAEYIPHPLSAVVMINRDRIAKMRRFATIYQMTAQEHSIPTQDAMTAAMVAEDVAEVFQGEGAVAHVPLTAHTAGVQVRASKMLLNDAAINLVNIIATRGGAALGVLEDNEFFKDGTGTSPHVTMLTGTSYVASLTTATALSYTNLVGMYHDLPQQYRTNAVFFVSSSVLGLLSNVRDTLGRSIYQGLMDAPGPLTDDPGAVGTLLRKPVYEVPLTPGTIWFGDPSQYAVGNRQGITIESSEHQLFSTRQVIWLITERIAGNNTDLGAAQFLTAIASANTY